MQNQLNWAVSIQYNGTNEDAFQMAVGDNFKGMYGDGTMLIYRKQTQFAVEIGDWLFINKDNDFTIIPSELVGNNNEKET